jgi:Flp pilus assembly protein TadB
MSNTGFAMVLGAYAIAAVAIATVGWIASRQIEPQGTGHTIREQRRRNAAQQFERGE